MQSKPRLRVRTLVVLLGLAANLIAAGAPLLHVLLHELHERGDHHHEHMMAVAWDHAPADTDHSNSDVHPQALHEDARLVKRCDGVRVSRARRRAAEASRIRDRIPDERAARRAPIPSTSAGRPRPRTSPPVVPQPCAS